MSTPFDFLAKRWREEAKMLRHRGQDALAKMAESYVQDLETALRESELEALSLQQAADESGYSYSAIQKKVAEGELENVGDKNRPRVRRGDLPRKTRCRSRSSVEEEPDLVGEILARRT